MLFRKIALAILALLILVSPAIAQEAKNIVDQCAFQVSEGSTEKIIDSSISTAWVPEGSNPEMMIRLPDSGATFFQINWWKPAMNFEIIQYDAQQKVLSTITNTETDFGFLANVYPIEPGAKYISVRFQQESQGINKVRVWGEGDLPATAARWERPHDDCDLMVISTHMDDEWLWFGGIIPYYDTVLGYKVQVVYMADCGRMRHAEALNALATAGVTTYPEFLDLKDERIDSLDRTLQHWGGREGLTELLVDLVRRYQPEVILTHDWDGEYGHNQHIVTSRCMEYIIEAAADPNQCPESAEKYGAWQVQKLYRHLEKKDPIEFNWHVSYPELGGRTLFQTAVDAMEENASQLQYFQVKDHGTYDNAKFGLSYSTVGEDIESKDLFENVVFPTPTPIPTATPAPTPLPTAIPVETALDSTPDSKPEAASASDVKDDAQTPAEPAPAKKAGVGTYIALGVAGILVLGAVALIIMGIRSAQIEKRRRKALARRRAAARKAQRSAGNHRPTPKK